MTENVDLFGNTVEDGKERRASRPPVNDMDLMETVLRTACGEGFMLVGFQENVFRKAGNDSVESVPREIEDAVHQLIDSGWLKVGGCHPVRYHSIEGQGRSVLVPRKSKDALSRWSALACPRTWKRHRSAS